jgi:putative tryptophan/tyrosine transport system substrate-binding protein
MLLLATIAVSEAQQGSGKIAHIGFLGIDRSASTVTREKAFLQGLRELGWIEGQNLRIERKYWENRSERLPALADELVRQKLNIIVTTSGTAAWAVKKVTNTIPIVMVTSADAVLRGWSPA